MDTRRYNLSSLQEAAEQLQKGELVSFPTETVYGLGAVASNQAAVEKVYQVKGRPSDNPLIVHVASKEIDDLVLEVPEEARKLMDAFWPGPLTLIFKTKKGVFTPSVTGGQETVALRMPDQALTLKLIEAAGFPLVGPSANTSGKPSPTTADHVLHDLAGKIAGVVDGGDTQIGVESTVLDLTDPNGFAVLRPGAVTTSELERVLNKKIRNGSADSSGSNAPKAPGMKYIHYSPKQPVYLLKGGVSDWLQLMDSLRKQGKKFGLLASSETIQQLLLLKNNETISTYSLGRKASPEEASQRLYAGLRYFDDRDVDVILAEAYPETGIGEAFMNRLEKASSFVYPSDGGRKS